MKTVLIFALIMLLLASCAPIATGEQITREEEKQQAAGNLAIVQNQPIPDLGGFALERQILNETYLARNQAISTFSYMFSMDGKIIEICPSVGYPIPYSTQLTNPMKMETYNGVPYTLPNAEPNSLYPPGDAAATLVQCVNDDGSVSPVYIEWYVLSFPYRIVSDSQLERAGETSFKVKLGP